MPPRLTEIKLLDAASSLHTLLAGTEHDPLLDEAGRAQIRSAITAVGELHLRVLGRRLWLFSGPGRTDIRCSVTAVKVGAAIAKLDRVLAVPAIEDHIRAELDALAGRLAGLHPAVSRRRASRLNLPERLAS